MLQGWRNWGPKTAQKTNLPNRFLLLAEPLSLSLSLSLHRGVQPPTSLPPAWTPPSPSQATSRTPHIVSAPSSLSPLQVFFILHQKSTPATIPSTEAYWATGQTSSSQPSFQPGQPPPPSSSSSSFSSAGAPLLKKKINSQKSF